MARFACDHLHMQVQGGLKLVGRRGQEGSKVLAALSSQPASQPGGSGQGGTPIGAEEEHR